jgi:UDP-N-acetylglucosamine 2-epimerase (non-hydrolysing)
MKVSPLYRVLARSEWCRPVFVHTRQHHDQRMAGAFLDELELPAPDFALAAGSGSHAEQTASILLDYERVCLAARPDWVVVVGDVNSTLACALAAKKLNLPVAHLEAGIRSFDRSMPEEINRLAVDAIADLLWTPCASADENLQREGVPPDRVEQVGNVMIDAYELLRPRIHAAHKAAELGLRAGAFGVVTLHRPSNVDQPDVLSAIVSALCAAATRLPLVFPIHPRTRQRIEQFGLWGTLANCRSLLVTEPLGYIAFMSLVQDSHLVITDSGGIQQETSYLRIPCLTLRRNTEWPITISDGTNRLVGPAELEPQVERVLADEWPLGLGAGLWDGRAATRAAASLRRAAKGQAPGSSPAEGSV